MLSFTRRNNWLWDHHGSITDSAPYHLIMHGPTLNLLIYNCEKKVGKKTKKKIEKKYIFASLKNQNHELNFCMDLIFCIHKNA